MDFEDNREAVGEPHDPTGGGEVDRFLELALGLRFETRFHNETRWWPVPIEDVGHGLASYHPDLEQCLERMLDGEVLGSRLSVYRIAGTAPGARSGN